MTKRCDGLSVGVYIWSPDLSELLMIERNTAPVGIAPPSGHGDLDDEHDTLDGVARDEVKEEVGLEVVDLQRLPGGGYHPGLCRRPGSRGHRWVRYRATTTGDVVISPREVRRAGWWSLPEIQNLAERTAAYAAGLLTNDEFAAHPGLEPVWCWNMSEDGHITLDPADLDRIEDLAANGGRR